MLNVNSKKCLRRLSLRSIQHNRSRNIIAILAIILTTVLFTSLFTVGASVIDSFQRSTMRQVGTSAHGGFKFLTQEQYDVLKVDPKIKDISYNILIGFGENPEFQKTIVEIRYTEEKNAIWGFTMPTTGTLPKNRLDIATSTGVLDALGLPHELGTQVPLEFTSSTGPHREVFTLCGFWEQDAVTAANEAYLSRVYCDEVAPVWHETQLATEDQSWMSGSINPSIYFSTSWNIEKQIDDLKQRCGFGSEVNEGVNWAYASSEADVTTLVLIVGILLLIILSGYLIIYNIFYISVSKDIRFYGLLKTIGTTGKQLKKLVRSQALLLELVGMPIGLILGYLISIFLVPVVLSSTLIENDMVISANPAIFVGSALFTLITVWISCIKPCRFVCKISPVEAVRYTEVVKIRKKQKKTRRVTPFSMAWDNMKRTPKKSFSVIISLSLSILLLNGTVTLVKGFDMDKYIKDKMVSDFYITDATVLNINSSYESYNSVSPELQEQIRSLPGIENLGSVYMMEHRHILDERAFQNAQQIMEQYKKQLPMQYLQEAERLLTQEHTLQSHLYGVDDFIFPFLEITEGTFDAEKFKTGHYVIVSPFTTEGDGRFYHLGDTVTIDFGSGRKKEYEVMAIGNLPYALGPQHTHMFDVYFTLPAQEFIVQTGETGALKTAFDVESSAYTAIEQWVKNYCETANTQMDYRSRDTYVKEFESMQATYLTVGSLLSCILAFIGILNFINSTITSVQTRRQELAVLQSIGMTGKQLKKMLIGEGLCHTIITILLVLLVGTPITYGLLTAIKNQLWFFTYHFTILPFLLCIPALLVLSALIPNICYRNMCRQSVVDRLRSCE